MKRPLSGLCSLARTAMIAVVLLAAALGVPAVVVAQTNPFLRTAPTLTPRTRGGPATEVPAAQDPAAQDAARVPFAERIYLAQLRLTRRIGELVTNARDSEGRLLLTALLGVTFFYGVVHSLGPGHRKTVLFGWIVANNPTIPAIAVASTLLGVFHLGSTLIVVLLAAAIRTAMGLTLMEARDPVQVWTSIASGMMVVALGVYLLVSLRGHDHGRRRDHHSGTHAAADARSAGSSPWMVGFSMGAAPCPGSMSILVVSFLVGDLLIGVAALVSISAGTVLTLFVLGLTGRFAYGALVSLGSRTQRTSRLVDGGVRLVQIAAAALILAYGLFWSIGGVAGIAM